MTRMPAVFLGHGNPMNAVSDNLYTQTWRDLGRSLPRPKAILAISAHWYLPTTAITAMAHPRTIHDFGGFPPELHRFQYRAPGDPMLAERVSDLLTSPSLTPVLDHDWGLDHGTWSVLCHLYPDADVPVVQLSLHDSQPPSYHYDLGRRLKPLRDEGILILGSGNLVHNLHTYAWGQHRVAPFDWAVRFEELAKSLMLSGKEAALVDYESLGKDALLSAPTPDHFLPLLYVLGTRHAEEGVTFPVMGIDGGSISMLGVRVG